MHSAEEDDIEGLTVKDRGGKIVKLKRKTSKI